MVLADSFTSFIVPAFAGRIVASIHPLYWVADHTERRRALERFFAGASDYERRAMIARYHARWILIDSRRVRLAPEEQERLVALGCVVAERESFRLLDLTARCLPDARAPSSRSSMELPRTRR